MSENNDVLLNEFKNKADILETVVVSMTKEISNVLFILDESVKYHGRESKNMEIVHKINQANIK